jgi:hypothetical protein
LGNSVEHIGKRFPVVFPDRSVRQERKNTNVLCLFFQDFRGNGFDQYNIQIADLAELGLERIKISIVVYVPAIRQRIAYRCDDKREKFGNKSSLLKDFHSKRLT